MQSPPLTELSKYHQAKFKRLIKNNWQAEAKKEVGQEYKTIAMVARMGEFFGQTQSESNDWKARMIKAGLSGRGLSMPEDWDTLSEADKQTRLDAVIAQLEGK